MSDYNSNNGEDIAHDIADQRTGYESPDDLEEVFDPSQPPLVYIREKSPDDSEDDAEGKQRAVSCLPLTISHAISLTD